MSRIVALFSLLVCLSASVLVAADRVEDAVPSLVDSDRAADPKGSLVIIGGSERFRDRELWDTVVELAGGDGAKIAVFPTAVGTQPIKSCSKLVQTLQRSGANAFIVPVAWSEVDKDIQEAVFDPELVEKVRSSTGVYFVGGAQGRIVDALLDDDREPTPMLKAIWEVYRRGGVIAGTSAGAAIMSHVMYRDAPPPLKILKDGVTMGKELDDGLSFLDENWFVEQHCLVRGRFARALVAMHSQGIPFGIGVDENTALVVKNGHDATVIGYKGVLIMDISEAIRDEKMDAFSLSNVKMSYLDRGDRIDLRTREVIPAEEKLDDIELDPTSDDFKPYFDHRMFYTDILGNCAVADLLGRLIDNEESEAIGLAFSGLDARREPSDGFEFRFYRGPDSKGWYTEEFGGEDYTVLNIHLDIHPIRIAGPLYEPRMASDNIRAESPMASEEN